MCSSNTLVDFWVILEFASWLLVSVDSRFMAGFKSGFESNYQTWPVYMDSKID
jgi:hypothetical protein